MSDSIKQELYSNPSFPFSVVWSSKKSCLPSPAYTTMSWPAVEYFLWQVLAHTKTRYLLRPPLILSWLLATEINITLGERRLYHGKYQIWENIGDAHTCWWNVSYLLNLPGIWEKYPGGETEATTGSRQTWSLARGEMTMETWTGSYLEQGAGASPGQGRARDRQEVETHPWRSETRCPCQHSSWAGARAVVKLVSCFIVHSDFYLNSNTGVHIKINWYTETLLTTNTSPAT